MDAGGSHLSNDLILLNFFSLHILRKEKSMAAIFEWALEPGPVGRIRVFRPAIRIRKTGENGNGSMSTHVKRKTRKRLTNKKKRDKTIKKLSNLQLP